MAETTGIAWCATAEHDDGETGHVFTYDSGARESICEKCGIPRDCTDWEPPEP